MIGEPLGGPTDLTTDVSFSPDGKRLVAGRFDGDTIVYDTATRRQALRIDGDSVVTAVAFHPDGKLIAVGTIDGKVRFFDPRSGAAVGSPLDVGSAAVWQVAFSPDGRLLAVAVDPNGAETASTASSGRARCSSGTWTPGSRVGRAIAPGAGSVLAVAFNPDGTLLATGSARAARPVGCGHPGAPRQADEGGGRRRSRASRSIRAAGSSPAAARSGPVRVWRVADQRPAFPPLSGHTGPVTGAAFDPAGSFLATTSLFGGTRLWDPGHGSRLRRRAGRKREARLARAVHRPSRSWGCGTRSARTASCWPSRESRRARCCGTSTRRSGAGVRARSSGRNLSREEWKLYLPPGTPYRATCSEWPTG